VRKVWVLDTDTWTSTTPGDRSGSDENRGSNIILLGGMGSGKSTIGWLLARLLGYGFIDTDTVLEDYFKKPIATVFDEEGEQVFRTKERELVLSLFGIRSHVISVGGGTVVDDKSWQVLVRMGVTVWLNPPAEEVARRFLAQESEILRRPLLADLMSHKDKETRQKLLTERLSAIIGNRADRYREAMVDIGDSFCTPESTTLLIRDLLLKDRLLSPVRGDKPYDRWGIL
jgi:shikimate kinase